MPAIKAELRRWHLCGVFVHQFSELARRVVAAPARATRGDAGGSRAHRVWWRMRPAKAPQLGLAAVKHAQRQQQRAAMNGNFRGAGVVAKGRGPPPDQGGDAPYRTGSAKPAALRRDHS